jgi:ABC-type bacteriocin/lantibiotic exporter with double-glycine peptidase domain
MSIYEFDAIIKFMGNIPNFASFPFAFGLTLILIVNQVGSSSLVLLPVFLVTSIILALLDHKMLKMNEKYKKIGSKRTLLLTEMLYDMKAVKINSWEDFFFQKLSYVRKTEIGVLNNLSLDRAISNSLFFLTPIMCSSLIIYLKRKSSDESLDVGIAFAIVSVLNQLQRPLQILSSSVDLYIDFKIGHTSLSRFFSLIH